LKIILKKEKSYTMTKTIIMLFTLFNKDEGIKPQDLASLFYSGVCYTYIAQRNNAALKFDKILEIVPKSQEAKDSQKWVNLKPLNLGIILIDNTKMKKKRRRKILK
jgi:hypothetical protein